MLRILYINDALRNFGPGPAVHGWALVNEMRGRGVNVRVLPEVNPATSGRVHAARQKLGGNMRRVLPGDPVSLVSGLARTLARSSAALARQRGHADVILARHTAYDWTPVLAARLLRLPLVLEVNAPLFQERQLAGQKPWPVLRWMEELQWRSATHVHVVSTELQRIVQGVGVPPERITVIPNGARPRPFVPRERGRDEPVRILFVGGFYPWHGVQELIHAVATIGFSPNAVQVDLIGSGPESDHVRALLRELRVEQVVRMHGRMRHEDVEAHLAAADIAVAPYPPFQPFYFSPLKIFEYMAAGLPIIASRQGQIAEVLEDGVTGFLYPAGSVPALAELLVKLVDSAKLRARVGTAAHEKVSNRYTWGHTAARIIDVCTQAALSQSRLN